MSDLKITFGADMPSAAVEVISPDSQVVARRMISAGASTTVPVHSEASALRIYLPDGPPILLSDPGNLDRTITLHSLAPVLRPTTARRIFPKAPDASSNFALGISGDGDTPALDPLPRRISGPATGSPFELGSTDIGYPTTWSSTPGDLTGSVTAVLTGSGGDRQSIDLSPDGPEARWHAPTSGTWQVPGRLEIPQAEGGSFQVLIPGSYKSVSAHIETHTDGSLRIEVAVRSQSSEAGLALNYLSRSELGAAEVMTDWAMRGRNMLADKRADPYAAMIGAYLLLRLKKNAGIGNWTKHLADWFPMSDGRVIDAWQLATTSPVAPIDVIRKRLLDAVSHGTPTYTEGLRLLLQGLQLLGPDTESMRKRATADLGQILWSSPFTAFITRPAFSKNLSKDTSETTYEIVAA